MSVAIVALLLVPHVVDATPMRLVSAGTGDAPVDWYLDGVHLGTTLDGEPLVVDFEPGRHEVWATSRYDGDWQVLARPEPDQSGVAYVPAWTARHEAPPPSDEVGVGWLLPAGLAALAGMLWLWPSRSKNP